MKWYNGRPVYEAGDVVRLVLARKDDECVVNVPPEMEREFGKTVTIEDTWLDNDIPLYFVIENSWTWDNSLIAGLECIDPCNDSESDEEISEASFGDFLNHFKVTI